LKITDDALVAVCLCTRLGRGTNVTPLNLQEWTVLVLALHRDRQLTPRALLGDVAALGLDASLTSRVEELLRGLASVGMELERLGANGIWVLTRGDEDYPRAWKRTMGPAAPPVLFGAGPRAALGADLVAIAGARSPDDATAQVVHELAGLCARDGWGVVSDGSRGVGRIAIEATSAAGGFGVEIVADSLEHALAKKANREAILDGRLTILTPHLPNAPFSAARASACNRLICSLARHVYPESARPLRSPLGDSIEAVFAGADQPTMRDGGQAEFDI